MEKLPYSKYTKKLRLEAVRLVTEEGLSVGEASMPLSLLKSTMENWLGAFKAGKLERIGASHRPLTDVEMELAIVRMERAISKKTAAYFAKESLHGTRRWCIGKLSAMLWASA